MYIAFARIGLDWGPPLLLPGVKLQPINRRSRCKFAKSDTYYQQACLYFG
jgi:hypothetical protein